MRLNHILGKFSQLSHAPWSQRGAFIRGWLGRHKTGTVPCAFPGGHRLVEVSLRDFYESYWFLCETKQGIREMKYFLSKLLPGDVLYDIGAFYGAYGAAAKSVHGDSIQLHSFEPVAENFRRTEEIYQRNGFTSFTLVPKAVGSGTPIAGSVDAHDGMLRQRDGMLTGSDTVQCDATAFPSTTVDAYSASTGVAPSVIKIDVEGFESAVLDGARETLRLHHPRLWLEIHPGFLSAQGIDWRQLVEMLKGLGYQTTFFEDFELPTRDLAFHIWCQA